MIIFRIFSWSDSFLTNILSVKKNSQFAFVVIIPSCQQFSDYYIIFILSFN